MFFKLPDAIMSGILFGSMMLYLSNSMIFHDKENETKGHITFDTSNYTDKIKGSIYKYNQKKLSLDTSIPINKVKDINYEICTIKGSWQQDMYFDETKVWDMDEVVFAQVSKSGPMQCIPLPAPNPLPSDSRYREDLIWLRKANIKNGEQWKLWLEE